VQLMVK